MAKKTPRALERVNGMIAHTEFASTDPAATKKFLGKLFKWEFQTVKTPTGPLISYETPGGVEGSIRVTQPHEMPTVVNYILVKDIEKTARDVKKAGGEIVLPTVSVPGMGRFFWFKVPGGPILACWADAPGRRFR